MDNKKQSEILEMKGKVLEHVLYEIKMYLGTKKLGCDNIFINNIILEDHRIHLRNLLEFFSKDYLTNIVYTDILKDTDAVKLLSQDIEEILTQMKIKKLKDATVNNLINKSTSHLTLERVVIERIKEDTAYDIANIAESCLVPLIKQFVKHLIAGNVKDKYLCKKQDRDGNSVSCLIDLKKELKMPEIQDIIKQINSILDKL